MCSEYESGSALIAALFLIVVLASLGAFAVRLGTDQRQNTNVQLLQYRALAAANSGIEFWARRVNVTNAAVSCTAPLPPSLTFTGVPALDGFTVTLRCNRIASGGQAVYEVTATAISGNFGNPDFVSRRVSRRITNIGPGTWHQSPT
jgi:MSHA biogenesis protein MshP